MAKRSKKRKSVARSEPDNILTANKILLADLPLVSSQLVTGNISDTNINDKYAIEVTDVSGTSYTTRKMFVSTLTPDPSQAFSQCSLGATHISASHEPEQSFIADAAGNYFGLHTGSHPGTDILRILARDDEYCDDRPISSEPGETVFEITARRPTVVNPYPEITAVNNLITDNILLTYGDLTNIQLKNTVGLPSTTSIKLYNQETDITDGVATYETVNSPTIDMFVSDPAIGKFVKYETTNTFYFKAGDRVTSTELLVNETNASLYTIVGVLAVKPKPMFINTLKTVTLYIELYTGEVTDVVKPDSDWIIAEAKVLPVYAYGTFASMSTYLCKDSLIRLHTNLDTTMGSINLFGLHDIGGFTNHFSNTFYGFSGVITF